MDPKCELLGAVALVPLAVLATSRGLGAGGMVFPAVVAVAAAHHSLAIILGLNMNGVGSTNITICLGGRRGRRAGFCEEVLGD